MGQVKRLKLKAKKVNRCEEILAKYNGRVKYSVCKKMVNKYYK